MAVFVIVFVILTIIFIAFFIGQLSELKTLLKLENFPNLLNMHYE